VLSSWGCAFLRELLCLAFSLQLDGQPWTPSCKGTHHLQWSFPPHCHNSHTPRHCCFIAALHTGVWPWPAQLSATMALPHHLVVAHVPEVHRHIVGMHDIESQDEFISDRWQRPKLLVGTTPEPMSLTLLSRWGGSLLQPSTRHTSWAGLSKAVLPWCPAWWSSGLLLHQQSQDIPFSYSSLGMEAVIATCPTCWACNKWAGMTKLSSHPFLLAVSPVLVILHLGGVTWGIPLSSSSQYGWRLHTASRRVIPFCCTWSLVNIVLWALQHCCCCIPAAYIMSTH
jgi:hypothetical protein